MTKRARSDVWMPLYIADYLRDTMHLTRDQHGGYMLLLMACWDRGGRLPNNNGQLAGIARATPAEWRKLRPVLIQFFIIDGAELVQKRVLAEYQKAAELSETRRLIGQTGGRPRKQTESKPKPIGIAKRNQTGLQTESKPKHLKEGDGGIYSGSPDSHVPNHGEIGSEDSELGSDPTVIALAGVRR